MYSQWQNIHRLMHLFSFAMKDFIEQFGSLWDNLTCGLKVYLIFEDFTELSHVPCGYRNLILTYGVWALLKFCPANASVTT